MPTHGERMSKLAILAVLAAMLTTACVAPEPYHYGYHHRYWRHAYWRHGYWLNGAWVNSNIYVDPNAGLPSGVTIPDTDASGNYIAPGVDANGNYVSPGVATANGAVVTPPSSVQPAAPNTASGVAP
jgi:hypothetical protein